MNYKEFIAALSHRSGHTIEQTQKNVKELVDILGTCFQEGETVSINGFGTFEVKKRLERVVVNPGTQQRMLVPPKLVLNFRQSANMKEKLNQRGTKHD
ncbi:MAG: HU family DNA-binding protein [Prevotella sp.]|nr:HU family DNA-binding protein [Prevotella sp.]